jgi:hypothetical protein
MASFLGGPPPRPSVASFARAFVCVILLPANDSEETKVKGILAKPDLLVVFLKKEGSNEDKFPRTNKAKKIYLLEEPRL